MVKQIFLDLETTGVNSWENGLIEIGAIIDYDAYYEEISFHLQPFAEDVITEEALKVTGLTKEEILKFESPDIVFKKFKKLLGQHVDKYDRSDKFFFIGYNATFDAQFLRMFFRKNNDKYYGSWFFNPIIDVMTLAGFVLMKERKHLPNFRLTTVANYLGIEVDESKAHGALYDTQLTRQVFYEVKKRLTKE